MLLSGAPQHVGSYAWENNNLENPSAAGPTEAVNREGSAGVKKLVSESRFTTPFGGRHPEVAVSLFQNTEQPDLLPHKSGAI